MAGIVVVGESLIDVVVAADGTRTEHVGGSATNAAVAMGRLGASVRLASSWGDDAYGAMIAAHLAADGVALACEPHALARTSTAVARVRPDGAASYDFDLEWRLSPVPDGWVPDVLYLCSLGAVLEPGASQALDLMRRWSGACAVVYDVNARPAVTGAGPDLVARVEALAALTDLVKASDEDLSTLYPGLTTDQAMAHLLALGPAAVAVTLGGAGAAWLDATGRWSVEALPVAVVDTIGAGDTFGAALVVWLLEHGGLGVPLGEASLDALRFAAGAAAVTVSRAGADPPYAAELRPSPA